MAKKFAEDSNFNESVVHNDGTIESFHLGDIAHLAGLNIRVRPVSYDPKDKTDHELMLSMASAPGWSASQDNMVVGPITDAQALEYVHQQKILMADLANKAKTDSYSAAYLEVLRSRHLDENGEFRKPKMLGATGNRRALIINHAFTHNLLELRADKPKAKVEDVVKWDIPTRVIPFKNDEERLKWQIMENNFKGGSKPLEIPDLLTSAVQMVRVGHNQNYLRKIYSVHNAMKLYHLALLIIRFPQLNIFDRITKRVPKDEDYIRWQSIKFDELPTISMRTDEDALEKYNKKHPDNPIEGWGEEELENYFANLGNKGPKGGTAKSMPAKDVANVVSRNSNDVIKEVMTAVVNNDPNTLVRLSNLSEQFNLFNSWTTNNHFDDLVELMRKLKYLPDNEVEKFFNSKTVKDLPEPDPEVLAQERELRAKFREESRATPDTSAPKSKGKGKGKKSPGSGEDEEEVETSEEE